MIIDFADVEILCTLRPGDTVALHQKSGNGGGGGGGSSVPPSIWLHRSWATAFHRMYFRESRHQVVLWVQEIVSFLKQEVWKQYTFTNDTFFQKRETQMQQLVQKLKRVIRGIQNLSFTYQDDHECTNQLERCILELEPIFIDIHFFIRRYLHEKHRGGGGRRSSIRAAAADRGSIGGCSYLTASSAPMAIICSHQGVALEEEKTSWPFPSWG